MARRLGQDPIRQRPFAWKLEKWLPVVADEPEAEAVIRGMPGQIDREAVRQVVQQQLDLGHGIAAFIPVMIWGGPGGYGPFRTRSILTGSRARVTTSAEKQGAGHLATVEEDLASDLVQNRHRADLREIRAHPLVGGSCTSLASG